MIALALVQARMGSTRLPGKALADLEGSPLVAHVLRRTLAARYVKHTVLCIPDTPENDVLVPVGDAEGVDVYRGSEPDVLSRLYWASQLYPDDLVILRVTADDPCKDPSLTDRTIEGFVAEWGRWKQDVDAGVKNPLAQPHYMHLGGATWPLGLDVEVVSRHALTHAYEHAKGEDREHAGMPWIRHVFGCWTLKDDQARPGHAFRLTVDTPDDLEFVRGIYANLYASDPLFGYDAILQALQHAEAA